MKINKYTFIKMTLTLIFIVSISFHSPVKAFNRDWQSLIVNKLENEFTRKGQDLKGDVFSVVSKQVGFTTEFGEYIPNKMVLMDSIIFNADGNISKVYKNPGIFTREQGMFVYTITPDSIIKNARVMSYDDIVKIEIVRDAHNRIKEYKKFNKDGKLVSKILFNHTSDGYEGEYWPDSQDKITFSLKGNILSFKDKGISGKYILNKNNKPIKLTWTNSFWGGGPKVEEWKYDTQGNVLDYPDNIGKIEYQYDSVGNWISKKHYRADGKLYDWEIREIVYKDLEDWKRYEKEQIEAQNILNQEILNKAAVKIAKLIDYKLEDFLYDMDRNPSLQRSDLGITNFGIQSDMYSFTFPDGTRVNNIKFNKKI